MRKFVLSVAKAFFPVLKKPKCVPQSAVRNDTMNEGDGLCLEQDDVPVPVFDLAVAECHEFCAAGLVLHNCGYGSGKTRANVFMLLRLITMLQKKKDRAGDYARIIVAGFSLKHLNRTLLVYLRQYLSISKTKYTENKKDNFFVIGTVTVLLVPIENPQDIFGEDACTCIVEEIDELTEDKALEAIKALRERTRQRITGFREPFLCLGSTSQGQKGLYRIYQHFQKTGVGFVLLRGKTEDNIYLPKSQISDMKKLYTKDEQRVFMDGEFLAISKGRVFGDFSWDRNYLEYDLDDKLEPEERIYIAMDFNSGYNRASAYIVREGVIYAIKRYDFPDARDAPAVFRHDFPNQWIIWIPDMTMKDSFPMFTRELRRYNIHIAYRKKNPVVEDTVFLCNKLFYTGRLKICAIAKDLAEACALAMRDKDNRVPKGVGPSSPIHDCDTVRYAAHFIALNRPGFQDLRRLVFDKRASLRDEDNDEPVKRLSGGYLDIAPEAFEGGEYEYMA
jgi:hypothetical protein